jgi:hypothetical protein
LYHFLEVTYRTWYLVANSRLHLGRFLNKTLERERSHGDQTGTDGATILDENNE